MILIFDLDDTLYDELTYVTSGLRAVASYGLQQFGWNPIQSLDYMLRLLEVHGRGQIFDLWLDSKGKCSRTLVNRCLSVYRHHLPSIQIEPKIYELLTYLAQDYPLYLVTDGHKVVQTKKVKALGISPLFQKVFITHRYGIRHAKPSTYCFELIRKRERCEWSEMAYIGDNPAKDFVSLNPLGVKTVRVKTGVYKDVIAAPKYDANISIPELTAILEVLNIER